MVDVTMAPPAKVMDRAEMADINDLRAHITACLASLRGARKATWRSPNADTVRVEQMVEQQLNDLLDQHPRRTT